MRSNRLFKAAAAVALAVGVASWTLHAQDATVGKLVEPTTAPSPANSQPHVSAEARVLLDQVRDAYGKLPSLDLAGKLSIQFDGGGQKRDDHAEFTGAFRSPNLFRHEMKNETTIDSNGQKIVTYLAGRNVYLTDDAPKSRAQGLPDQVNELLMQQNPSLALALAPDASDLLIAGATDVRIGDDRSINGQVYPNLKLTQSDEDETVLIDPRTHLIHSVEHNLLRSMQAHGVPNPNVALVTLSYEPAASSQAVSFDWTPPADARPFSPTPQADADGPEAAKALEGKPAPDFTLKTLDGKSVHLSALKGQVVVLDFWATWCGPCREGLPHIDKVAKDRAADGVKVFAVNCQEDAATVQPFVQQNNLSLPVLLDSDGAVQTAYMGEAIPETVIINKNGTVQKVFIGLEPDEEKAVNDQIDAALKAN